jgi:hypothetical protein
MRTIKNDFRLDITSNDIPENLRSGLTGISIFRRNIVIRFAAFDDDSGSDPVISKFDIESLDDSRKELEKKLSSANIESKLAQKLVTFIVGKVLDKVEQGKSTSSLDLSQPLFEGIENNEDDGKDKPEYIYKYSKLDNKQKKKVLHEAAIITSNSNDHEEGQMTRRSVFLYYDKAQDKIKAVPAILQCNRILKPAEEDEYQYIPYTYDMDIDEVNLIKDQLRHEKIV